MRGLIATLLPACIGVCVGACAHLAAEPRLSLPEPHLAPAAFGGSVAMTQRLTLVSMRSEAERSLSALPQAPRSLDVLLEIDPSAVRLAGFALGQRVLTLTWDGAHLRQERHALLPREVDAARVLRDIQLTYWPAPAVAASLPAGWTIDEPAGERVLSFGGEPQMRIHYSGEPRWSGVVELDNLLERYRLTIESAAESTADSTTESTAGSKADSATESGPNTAPAQP